MVSDVIDVNSNIALPIYRRIEEDLRQRIRDGRWAAGVRIPGRRELAKRYNVEVNTVQRAIATLFEDGLLRAESGKGTFVADHVRSREGSARRSRANTPEASSFRLGIALTDVEAIPDTDNYAGHILRGIRRALAPHGLRHSVTFVEHWDFAELSSLSRSELAGLLLVSPDTDKRGEISQLWRGGLPVVVVGSSWPGMDVPFIDSDNYGGVLSAVDHLVRLGHKRIACAVVCANSCNHRDRADAFRRVMSEYGLAIRPEHLIERWKPTREEGLGAIRAILEAPDHPTALITLSDTTAIAVLGMTREMGIEIPGELSIITFDDTRAARHAMPPLSTVAAPFEDMGEAGARWLLDLCTGKPFQHAPAPMPMRFIERASTGRPFSAGAGRVYSGAGAGVSSP